MDNKTYIKLEASASASDDDLTTAKCIFMSDFIRSIKNETTTSVNEFVMDSKTSIKVESYVSKGLTQNEEQCCSTNVERNIKKQSINYDFEMGSKISFKDEYIFSDIEIPNGYLECTSVETTLKNNTNTDNDFTIIGKLESRMQEIASDVNSENEKKYFTLEPVKKIEKEIVIDYNRDVETITKSEIKTQSQANEAEESESSKKVMAEEVQSSASPRFNSEASRFNCPRGGFTEKNGNSLGSNRFHKDQVIRRGDKAYKSEIICDFSVTRLGNLRQEVFYEGKKVNKCNDMSFTELGSMQTLKLSQEYKKTHKCDVCDKSFSLLGSLKTHKLIHEGKKPHKCNICEKSFTQLGHLKRHKLIHEGKKPHMCDVCDKSFTQVGHLKRHKLIHEGKKPYKCNVCEISFTQLEHLKAHKAIHEGKKPHKCDLCDVSFKWLRNLKTHRFIHESKKSHKCSVCDVSFKLLKSLKRHKLIHEGKKPHKCDVCGKCFTMLADLKRHKLIHEHKKPYNCDSCARSFRQQACLRKHKLTHNL